MSLIAFINLLDGEARILYTSCFVWFLTTVLLNGTRRRVSTSPLVLTYVAIRICFGKCFLIEGSNKSL